MTLFGVMTFLRIAEDDKFDEYRVSEMKEVWKVCEA